MYVCKKRTPPTAGEAGDDDSCSYHISPEEIPQDYGDNNEPYISLLSIYFRIMLSTQREKEVSWVTGILGPCLVGEKKF